MKTLVLGGNRFFGRRLVAKLLQKNHEITIFNRGNRDDGFGNRVQRIKGDRRKISEVKELQNQKWDLVYDQICFDAHEAREASRFFSDRAKRYIFTSTQSVYGREFYKTEDEGYGADINESAFDPYTYAYPREVGTKEDYGEGKRQAEAVFFKEMKCPLVAVRLPIVLGIDDYTERLKFHVEKIKNGVGFFVPNLDAKICFVSSEDAASVLEFLATSSFTGPINCCSAEYIVLRDLISKIEQIVGKKAVLTDAAHGELSPFGFKTDKYLNVERLQSLGFHPQPLLEWLLPLVKELSRI